MLYVHISSEFISDLNIWANVCNKNETFPVITPAIKSTSFFGFKN